ncbi:MAG: CHAT domain-containing protein [Aureispira sp.]
MFYFLLLLFLLMGYPPATLAQDYPSNLDSIIDGYSYHNQLEEAVSYLDVLLQKAEQEYGNQSDTFAFYLGYQANIIRELGHYDKAIQLFEQTITIYEHNHSKKHIKLTLPLTNLANIYTRLGQYQLAQELLNRALNIIQETTPSDVTAIARIYNRLSCNYWVSGRANEGLKFGHQALDLLSKAKEKNILQLIRSYENIASAYGVLNQYEDAVPIQKKAIDLQQEHFSTKQLLLAPSFTNLAHFYSKMNRNHEALPYHQKAIELMQSHKGRRHPEVATCINNLANCYTRLGQFDKSESLLLEAVDIFRKTLGPENPSSIVLTNNIGGLYATMQDFEQAKIYFQKALELGQKVFGKDHPHCITFQSSLAAAHMKSQNYEEALKLFLETAETAKTVLGYNSIIVIKCYNQIAQCYLFLGPDFHPRAQHSIEQSITLNALETIDINNLCNDLTILSAQTFKSDAQLLEALKILAKIQHANYQESNNQQFLLDSYKTQKALAYFSQQLQNTVYTRKDKLKTLKQLTAISSQTIALVDELVAVGYTSMASEAITFAEYNKSAVLSSALQGNQAINFGEIPDSLKSRERTLKKETALVKKKIIQSTTNEDEETLQAANQELIDVQLKQDKLRQLLKDNYPKYNALKNEQKLLTTAIVQEQLLTPQSALLEYCVYDSAVYVIVITQHTVQLQKLPIQKEALRKTIKRFRKSLSNYQFVTTNKQEAYALYTHTAFDLYQVLIAPIKKHLTNIKQLIIIPDNDLGHMPFEPLLSTLPKQQIQSYKNLDYLLRDYTIRYSYSASLLLENKRYKNTSNNGKILGFAASYNPNDSSSSYRSPSNVEMRKDLSALPGAAKEIKTLQVQFSNSDFFFGKDATEAVFKEKAANYAILHLALHGIANNHYPLLSCLAFTEDHSTTENNFLEAHEISNLQLYNDLVVLSACKTGYGKFEQGEGVLSLARSFMYAGTPSLVVSLWEVDDVSTTTIMGRFYQHLANGMNKDEALSQAKLNFIQQMEGEITHPAFWSPFIILGDNQVVHLKSPTPLWQWGLMGVGLFLLSLLFLFIKKRLHKTKTV